MKYIEKAPARLGLIHALVESSIQLYHSDKALLDEKLIGWFGVGSIDPSLPAEREHIPRVPFPDLFEDLTPEQTMTVLNLMELMRLDNAVDEFEELG